MRYSKGLILAIFLAGFHMIYPATAQNLSISDIPENLSRGVNSVIRNSSLTLTIPDYDKMVVNKSLSLTIMNEKALPLAHLAIYYKTGEKVTINSAAIYNEAGIKIKTIKKPEMSDRSMVDNASLYNDARMIYYGIVPVKYPFTVVYDYEIMYNRLYATNNYSPYLSNNQSVEYAQMNVINPKNIPLNVKTLNIPVSTQEIQTGTSRTWEFIGLPAIVEEPVEPTIEEFVPLIKIAPEVIQYDKYKGKSDTWQNYGNWLAGLSVGRRNLSSTTVNQLTQMVSKTESPREKVKILYKYLQSRTRYISISLGIGGLQPHQASEVDELGYGDCKDLSNYMVAMLDAVGIKSFYTVVNSGDGEYGLVKDQPGHQFDHAIVCVPFERDTIWLECTSQINPFGHLGSFTDNRPVLIIGENSGVLAKTPEYTIDDNFINSKINVDYSPEGTSATGTISYSGLLMDEAVYIANQNKAEQLDWVNKNLGMADYTVISHKFRVNEEPEPSVSLTVDLALNTFFTGNNARLFASMNLNNQIGVPARVRNRKHPVYIPYAYKTSDTVIIKLPAGYKPEQLPESRIADERFGKYSMLSVLQGKTITCVRVFEGYKGTHSPELYNAYYEFLQKAAVSDSKQLILIRE